METYKWLLLTTGGMVKIQNIYGQSAAKLLSPIALKNCQDMEKVQRLNVCGHERIDNS